MSTLKEIEEQMLSALINIKVTCKHTIYDMGAMFNTRQVVVKTGYRHTSRLDHRILFSSLSLGGAGISGVLKP